MFILRKTCTCSIMVFFSCFHISSLVDGKVCLTLVLDVLDTEYQAVWSMARCAWHLYLMYLILSIKQSGRWQESLGTCTWCTWYWVSSSLVNGKKCLILVLDILDTEYQAVWSMSRSAWHLYLMYLILSIKQSGQWQEVLDTCTWCTWYWVSSSLVDGKKCLVIVLDILDNEYQAVWSMARCAWYLYLMYLILSIKQSVRWQDVLDTQYQVYQGPVPSTSCHRPDCLYGRMKEIP